MIPTRKKNGGIRIKIGKRRLIFLLVFSFLFLIGFLYLFFFTSLFSHYRDLLFFQKDDQKYSLVEVDLTAEEKEQFEEQQIINQRGYSIVEAFDMRDNSVTPLLALEELELISYDILDGVIFLEMIWRRPEGGLSLEATSTKFILHEGSYNSAGFFEISEFIEVDSSSNLEELLAKDLQYAGNFTIPGDEQVSEKIVEEYLTGEREFKLEVEHLTKFPEEGNLVGKRD